MQTFDRDTLLAMMAQGNAKTQEELMKQQLALSEKLRLPAQNQVLAEGGIKGGGTKRNIGRALHGVAGYMSAQGAADRAEKTADIQQRMLAEMLRRQGGDTPMNTGQIGEQAYGKPLPKVPLLPKPEDELYKTSGMGDFGGSSFAGGFGDFGGGGYGMMG